MMNVDCAMECLYLLIFVHNFIQPIEIVLNAKHVATSFFLSMTSTIQTMVHKLMLWKVAVLIATIVTIYMISFLFRKNKGFVQKLVCTLKNDDSSILWLRFIFSYLKNLEILNLNFDLYIILRN